MALLFFFFKQKTAYEMRISDWSSDVCSSDLQCTGIDEAQALRVAASLERNSGHPLAVAFIDAGGDVAAAGSLRAVAGQGIEGVVDGDTWRLGQAGFAVGGIDDGAIWLGDDGGRQARFTRSEGHTSELQSLMRISYAVFCLKKKTLNR